MYDLSRDLSFEDPGDILVTNKDIVCSIHAWTLPSNNLKVGMIILEKDLIDICVQQLANVHVQRRENVRNYDLPMLFGCKTCPSIVNRSLSIIVGKHQQLVSSKNRSLVLACTTYPYNMGHKIWPKSVKYTDRLNRRNQPQKTFEQWKIWIIFIVSDKKLLSSNIECNEFESVAIFRKKLAEF